MLELALEAAECRTSNSLAGKMGSTTGITILKQVIVTYETKSQTCIRQGPLASGELSACVDGSFKVVCPRRCAKRAALLTNYDYAAAPSEAG